MLEKVARETNQKVVSFTFDSQQISFPPLQCYRNFGCSRPWGIFEDVNHIISNLGYIVYGAAFILMVQLFTLSAHIFIQFECKGLHQILDAS